MYLINYGKEKRVTVSNLVEIFKQLMISLFVSFFQKKNLIEAYEKYRLQT